MNYKVSRIGLLNFWYFDDEELNFFDGKMLLRGGNGSGKSVTMQSFIPLILDGNKTPNRLDPFGSKEKKIEDYLIGPSDGVQKEDSIGYLYMEAYNEQIDKYITVGIGLRARKGRGTDFWGFALKDGKRIGKDFFLYKDYGQKVLLTKNELKARLGKDNEFTEVAKEYKAIVNKLLFGFKEIDAYDEFINVLLQLRSSKLSKEYTPIKLMNILSSVLQPLTEDDLRPISEVIEDTTKTRETVEKLTSQVKNLSNFLKTYQNYNEILLYDKAKSVKEEETIIKNKKEDISLKENEIDKISKRLEEIKEKFALLEKEYNDNSVRLETIDNKELKNYTDELEKIKQNINSVQTDINNIKEKIEKVAREIYGADGVDYAPAAVKQLKKLEELGFGTFPVCMAKTQYSLSDDPSLLGRPKDFRINVREVYVCAGAGFVVVLTGAVMTMPGLPKNPAAFNIDVDENGVITGLF